MKFENNIQKACNSFLIEDQLLDIEYKKRMLSYKFLSEIEKISDRKNITRKKLAKLIGTSASYITQLFRGNKILNLETIVKFENALKINFEILALSIKDNVVATTTPSLETIKISSNAPNINTDIFFYNQGAAIPIIKTQGVILINNMSNTIYKN